jgi:hypothetical protein
MAIPDSRRHPRSLARSLPPRARVAAEVFPQTSSLMILSPADASPSGFFPGPRAKMILSQDVHKTQSEGKGWNWARIRDSRRVNGTKFFGGAAFLTGKGLAYPGSFPFSFREGLGLSRLFSFFFPLRFHIQKNVSIPFTSWNYIDFVPKLALHN